MTIRLTQLSEAGGCGCKIPPNILDEILGFDKYKKINESVLVGYNNRDDAAVYKLNSEINLVSTIDFFTPIVDDAFLFGQIAAANALSDIYAMGGKPLWALGVLCIPIDIVKIKVCKEILKGASSICSKANISIIGGQSINNPQPVFGLTVNGIVKKIKENKNAKLGDDIYITKPLGTGIISNAIKFDKIIDEDYLNSIPWLTKLNSIGEIFSELEYVNSMTDITGFGLIGHLTEMCIASSLSSEIYFNEIQILSGVKKYIEQGVTTKGGAKNWNYYKIGVSCNNKLAKIILSDPQSNGGLMVSVDKNYKSEFQNILRKYELLDFLNPIGKFISKKDCLIQVL